MITPGTYDLPPMIRGTNYEFGFTIKSDSVPKDLTGCTIQIVLQNDDITITLIENTGLVIDRINGTITIDLDDTDINAYPLGEFLYKLNITETNGDICRYLEGRITVRE